MVDWVLNTLLFQSLSPLSWNANFDSKHIEICKLTYLFDVVVSGSNTSLLSQSGAITKINFNIGRYYRAKRER